MLQRDVPTTAGIGIGMGRVAASITTALVMLISASACGQKGPLVSAKPLPPASTASSVAPAR